MKLKTRSSAPPESANSGWDETAGVLLPFRRVLILAVLYDVESLNRRLLALEHFGNVVVPASSFDICINAIFNPFHLLIIGASVPEEDRQRIAEESKRVRPTATILSVEWPDAQPLQVADVRVPAGDEQKLIEAVKRLRYGI